MKCFNYIFRDIYIPGIWHTKVILMKPTNIPAMFAMLMILAGLAVAGCASPSPTDAPTAVPTAAPTGPILLTINGSVATPLQLNMDDLKTYPQNSINLTTTNNKGTTTTASGTGPLLNALLDKAGPAGSATSVTLIGADGYAKAVNLSDIRGTNSTVMIRNDGTLQDVIPTKGAGSWVANLTAIVVG